MAVPERASDSLELELHGSGESPNVGAENRTQAFRRAAAPLIAGPPPKPHHTTVYQSDGRAPVSIPGMVPDAGRYPAENLSSKI